MIDPAVGLVPDLRAGLLVVGLGVGRVVVLVGLPAVGRLALEPRRHRVVGARILGLDVGRADDDLGAEGAQRVDLLLRLLVGGGEDAVVALDHRGDGQAHAGVARGALDDRAAGLEPAVALGVLDHLDRHPVLDRVAGVEGLDLGDDLGGDHALGDAVEPHHRRVADGVEDGSRRFSSAIRCDDFTAAATVPADRAAPARDLCCRPPARGVESARSDVRVRGRICMRSAARGRRSPWCCVPRRLPRSWRTSATLSFPTSGSAEAQQHFLRGVAILHSFGWKQAIAEFQAAQKLQPDFAMAYWGETLCYNHPLNAEQDAKNPRAVLARLGPDRGGAAGQGADAAREGLPRRRSRTLWADGPDWRARRVAYMKAMERLHQQFPADDEVTTFYALSLLSGARAHQRRHVPAGDEGRRAGDGRVSSATRTIRARRTTSSTPSTTRCTRRSALDAAFVYAKIVPAVSHAVHMPTHIFIQHGMWNEVAHQNVRAFNIAKDLFAARRHAGRHVALRRLGPVRIPAARRLRRRARADPRVRGAADRRPSTRARSARSRW